MFKRSEKKIKAVFKIQFQATKVPQMKAKSLMISLVPVDVGKATLRLSKAPIIEGTCIWEHPAYETMKLVQEIKTGRIREKFYYVVVSTGSSKSGFLGEVSIDFADLAEATRPVTLTLPLQTSKSGAVLNVIVQRMQGGSDSSRHGEDGEEPVDYQSLDTSGNLSEATSPRDEQDGSIEDAELDTYDAESRDGVKATSDDKFEKLTNQIKTLERKVELSDLEVLSLRKQIMKENAKGRKLSEEITSLTEERDALRTECEQLKSAPKCKNEESIARRDIDSEIMRSSLEDIKHQLQREKQLNKKLKLQVEKAEDSNSEFVIAMRDLTKKLEQKNAEVSRLSNKLKAFYSGAEDNGTETDTNGESKAAEDLKNGEGNNSEAEMLKQKIELLNSEIDALKKEKAEIQMEVERISTDYEDLEIENRDILSKLEHNEKEKMDIQQNHLETLASLKQFKTRVSSLEEEVKRQKRQYSESLDMIDELEIQVESMQKDLENQAQVFEEDLERVTVSKVEQEQRAIRAEEALRQAKLKAEKFEQEMNQHSAEMSLRTEENEKIYEKAVSEADDLRNKNKILEDELRKAKEEVVIQKDQHEKIARERVEQKNDTDRADKLEKWISEKEELMRELARVTKEADKLKKENVSVMSQVDQKKSKEEYLQLEVKKMRLKNSEVRNQLLQVEKEKEGLMKEISKLKDGLHKKQQVGQKAAMDQKTDRSAEACDVSSMSSELASLQERNKSMEQELKEMHDRYSEISLRFAEVEGQRQQLVMELRLKTGKKN